MLPSAEGRPTRYAAGSGTLDVNEFTADPAYTAITDAFHARINIAPAPIITEKRNIRTITCVLFRNILRKSVSGLLARPLSTLDCKENASWNGRKMKTKLVAITMPRKNAAKIEIMLLCRMNMLPPDFLSA